jgi:hypothetical protein
MTDAHSLTLARMALVPGSVSRRSTGTAHCACSGVFNRVVAATSYNLDALASGCVTGSTRGAALGASYGAKTHV